MAIVLNSEAGNTSSVNNEMLFVAYEATKANDPVTYPDYTYVCDVYVDGDFAGRIKSRPDPINKRGIFDVSKILQSFATYGLKASSVKEDYTVRIPYQLKFGEEYDFTLYTNLVVDSSDRYCYTTYKPRPFTSTGAIKNGVVSNMPSLVSYNRTQPYHFVSFHSNVTGVAYTDATIDYFDSTNSNLGTYVIDNSDYIVNTVRQINVANPAMPANTAYAVINGDIALRINYLCNGKYTPYTLAWLNPYGGYDSMSFGFVSRKTIDITRKDFSQLPYRLDASGNVSYEANNVFYGSKQNYAASVQQRMRLTSHLLTADEYKWMADLFISPLVYLYDSEVDKFLPVRVTPVNYEYRNYSNSKLQPLIVDVEFSDLYNSQYL
jgi:hypothetical protein